MAFDDLLAANRTYADDFQNGGFDGIAKAGVAMVTCMDSRIDPLKMIGLEPGDAKILRNPGGRVTDQVLVAVVLGVTLLQVRRVLVIQHTRCAMASAPEAELQARVGAATGTDASWMSLGAITDQESTIRADVHKIESHPLVPDEIEVGGFVYDVDSGLLTPVA
ncbi:beta-class carbonic anhydrase [Aeromicrobium sp. Sec7.5]|uniref:beta-class carbonic anhydrase n=1 Tax=Aeromicrobium sp. Sec7.5 TaxID=3121276 RepID=UPI002FE4BE4A